MHDVEFWRWRTISETTGRRYTTRHWMTAAEALARDPTAERVAGTCEVRCVTDPGEHRPSQRIGGPITPST